MASLLKPILLLFLTSVLLGQEVEIQAYWVDQDGTVQLSIDSDNDKYYVLAVRQDLSNSDYQPSVMAIGSDDEIILSEVLSALPLEHYRVMAHKLDNPQDHDQDGDDDIFEFLSENHAPFNPSEQIAYEDGVVHIPDMNTFHELSRRREIDVLDQRLGNLEIIKFVVTDSDSDNPGLYFLNSSKHLGHNTFAEAIGIPYFLDSMWDDPEQMRGQLILHPDIIANNGTSGTFRFRFQQKDAYSHAYIYMVLELLGRNLPFLKNNLCYYPLNDGITRVEEEMEFYEASRVCLLYESDLYADLDYIPYNQGESYGVLTKYDPSKPPDPREIVLLEAIPNEISRRAGFISTVVQTPLAHVNLRAIQDGVPNAFIRGATDTSSVINLLGKYIHLRVEKNEFTIKEATIEDVQRQLQNNQPPYERKPVRDLSQKNILPLDEIRFNDYTSFGSKCANVAEMSTFGFPSGTIPDGFGIPFHFYDAFMRHNELYAYIENLTGTSEFKRDFSVQEETLQEIRNTINQAELPQWMRDELQLMYETFPTGTSMRCRSSSNNEDLPGFIGAGLYTSKTHHPDEGHIEKTIKQVYASLWNFRAFAERDFFRIDHGTTAMGILCHPNFEQEQANGVGVSLDPFYGTEGNFYFNSQLGEDLITNPDALSNPEELLIQSDNPWEFIVVNRSNKVERDELVLRDTYFSDLIDYLQVITDKFGELYEEDLSDGFAMEIEYKVTSDGRLVIKQARPWSAFWIDNRDEDEFKDKEPFLSLFPNPAVSSVTLRYYLPTAGEVRILTYDVAGRLCASEIVDEQVIGWHTYTLSDLSALSSGLYNLLLIHKDKLHSIQLIIN